jgi:hypothetical protein
MNFKHAKALNPERRKMKEELEFPLSPTGAWIITRVFSATGISIDVKASGTNAVAAIDDLYTGIAHGIEKYHWQLEVPKAPTAPPPAKDAAAKIAAEEGNQELATELEVQGLEVPPPPKDKEWQITDCVFLEILPQPDERVTLKFYGNDRKQPHNDYPSVSVNKWAWEQAQGLLKHVTTADVSKAAEFSLPCRVYWTLGKSYTKPDGSTGQYKDVAHVRPL